ncbi:MAG: UDP-2,4-diacetamido-2,4,6-trideoxy-beta-L-altropyranose hydrolase [Candidatus Flexifilum sp.]
MIGPLVIRADASPQIGSGHVMRCLALAQAWRDRGGQVTFICAQLGEALHTRLNTEGMAVQIIDAPIASADDARWTRQLVDALDPAWLVLDGYQFDRAYQQKVGSGRKTLMLDDTAHLDGYAVTAILNQNPSAHPDPYREKAPEADLLLGPRYALLRREFKPYRLWQRVHPQIAARLLVTLGGADPDNATASIIAALEFVPHPLEVRVVVGHNNPHRDALRAAAQRSRHQVTVESNVTDMPGLMAWADAAIAAAGSTLWEIALFGLPVLTVTLAENQAAVADTLAQRGLVIQLDRSNPNGLADRVSGLLSDQALRQRLSMQLQALIDGFGVERVLCRLLEERVWLRRAHLNDMRQIWLWANDPVARSVSFHSAPIPWDDHVRWYTSRMTSAGTAIDIAFTPDDRPVGQVRFDAIDTPEAIISVIVDPQFRGQGIGSALIQRAVEQIFQEAKTVQRVLAWIKPDNLASRRAFERAGFVFVQETRLHGAPAVQYVYARSTLAV